MGWTKIFNPKFLLLVGIVIAVGYLASKFPDQAILIGGIAIILGIGFLMFQAEKEREGM